MTALETQQLVTDVRRGLTSPQKWLPPKWFYDKRGSDLFDAITRLPEYYQTEAERSILLEHRDDILSGVDTLIELGSGTSDKTRDLLDVASQHGVGRLVASDVSEATLHEAVAMLSDRYPSLTVEGVVGDVLTDLDGLPSGADYGRRTIALLGSTIGNLFPEERHDFLATVARHLGAGDRFLLGTDLVKDSARLVRAYDDAEGVTAEFNRNVLRVINDRLDADFDDAGFRHQAAWDAEHERIEMRLVAEHAMTVHIPGAELDVEFGAGEWIRTEISSKFRLDRVTDELAAAGLGLDAWWTDRIGDFALSVSSTR